MKRIKMDAEALKQVFEEKYAELVGGKALPASMTVQLNPSVKLAEDQKVEVWFRNTAYKKMQALIDQCPDEIGWHGTVNRTDKKHFEITDILVFPQNVTGTTVTPDETEYTQWMIKLAMENEDAFNHMRFHGHSHVKMATNPSKVDTDYQENLMQNFEDYYIFGIFNKNDSWWMNIWDMEDNILYEKDDIKYLYEPEPEEEWASEQIKECIKKDVYIPKTTMATTAKETNKSTDTNVKDNRNKSGYDDDWDDYFAYPEYNYFRSRSNKGKGFGGYVYD